MELRGLFKIDAIFHRGNYGKNLKKNAKNSNNFRALINETR